MKITTVSSLAVATVALALFTTTEAKATTGCAASKALAGFTTLTTPTESNPTAGLGHTPDGQAMAKALGSFGIVATLITGGTLLYRRQRSADGLAAVEPEADLDFTVQPEAVLVSEALLAAATPTDEAKSAEAPVLSR
jgi:hypothetical protein